MTEYPIGARVILQNLTKGTHYNGKVGIVTSVRTATGRQLVSIVGDEEAKALGLKPTNLKYEPRAINSLSIKEMKIVLKAKKKSSDNAMEGGMDKSQLSQLVEDTVESEEEVAEILARAKVNTKVQNQSSQAANQASQVASMTPEQLRSQAKYMRSMDSATIRLMNPAMANFSDAQIQMAANEMDTMASNPEMFKNMVNQMKNMSGAELDAMNKDIASGNNNSPSPVVGGSPPQGARDITKQQMESGMQNMANLTPDQLRQQASMMKSMDPATLRRMNPAMANWNDAQIQMAITQMDMMADNPDMMKNMAEQVKNMNPEDIQKMQAEAMAIPGNTANGAAGGMPQDPMQMLQNADPAQIKQMMNMVKDNPELMKNMIRSANPSMGDQISDDQISKTMEMFTNMDEKNIEKLMKYGKYAQKASEYVKGKGFFIIIVLGAFCYGVIAYLVISRGKGSSSTLDDSLFVQPEPAIPVMDDEFASVEL